MKDHSLTLNQIAFNTVSAQLKLQGQALESVKNSLQDLTADLQELKEDRRVLLEKVQRLQENNAVDEGKIPPEISVSLKIIMIFSLVVYLIFDFH